MGFITPTKPPSGSITEPMLSSELAAKINSIPADAEDVAPLITPTVTGSSAVVYDSAELPLRNVTIYGKSIQDGIPTPDAPVDIVNTDNIININVTGKNLLKPFGSSKTVNGVTITNNGDGTYTLNGTASGAIDENSPLQNSNNVCDAMPKGTSNYFALLHISGNYTGTNGVKMTCWSAGWGSCTSTNNSTANLGGAAREAIKQPKWFRIAINNGVQCNNLVVAPIVGVLVDTFEPYKNNNTTYDASLVAPNGLKGIPVTSGGNYTDADGQQWICDTVEIDEDGNAEYVERVAKIDLSGESNWALYGSNTSGYERYAVDDYKDVVKRPITTNVVPNIMCPHLQADSPDNCYDIASGDNKISIEKSGKISVALYTKYPNNLSDFKVWASEVGLYAIAELAEPVRTPITATQLQSYYPNTVITNSVNADMEITYGADTKNYVDGEITKRFNELSVALIASESEV